jgi:hypothetical protein
VTEDKWTKIMSRLRTVHERSGDAIRKFEALIETLRDGDEKVAETPRVSVGWLLYTKPGCPGEVTVGLGQGDRYAITVSQGTVDRTTEVQRDELLVELDLALGTLAGTATPMKSLDVLRSEVLQDSADEMVDVILEEDPEVEVDDPSLGDLAEVFVGAPREY